MNIKKTILMSLLLVSICWATVNDNYIPQHYIGNGSTVDFAFPWPITDTSDVEVIIRTIATEADDVLTETTDYAISAINNDYSSGGTVTTVATYESTSQITIRRDTPPTQNTGLVVSGSNVLREDSLEDAYDKLTRLFQELQEIVGRCLKIPKTETNNVDLVSITNRADKNITFGAEGDVTVTSVLSTGTANISAYGETLIDDGDEAEARGTLGLDTDDDVEFAAITGTTGTFSGAISGTTGTFSGAISGTTGTFTDLITKGPWIDARAYGADPTGADDSTTAIQASLDAAGYVNMAHSSGTAPTLVGDKGKPILLPPGVYKVTGTLYYYPGQTIYGYGMQSCISFQPITALKDLFAPKPGVGIGADNMFRTMYFKKLLLTCNSVYGQRAIHFDDVTRWAVDDLCIQGFKRGIKNEGTSVKFFNRITSTFFRDCEVCFENEGAVCKISNSIFNGRRVDGLWEATADYNILNATAAKSISIDNCNFEGVGMTAHIYSQGGGGLNINGTYYEDVPLVLLNMNREKRTWGQTSITGNWGLPVLVKFEDLMETPTVNFRYPRGISLGGDNRLLNLIANPSAKRGSIGWDVTNGAITYSPDAFMSRFAWRLTADGVGACYIYQTVATLFERPLGARFTVTFLAKKSHATDNMIYSNVNTEIVHRAYEVIDYGNDWSLYAINIENTDELFADTQIIIRLTDATGSTPINGHYADISNIRIYEGEGFDIFPGDTESEAEIISDAAPTDGTWEQREKVWITAPAGGSHPGWYCITSGTFSAATDNTGDTDGSTAIITGMADTSDFFRGQYITTSAGFPNSVDDGNVPIKIISIDSATQITIDDTSDSAEADITVLTPDPVFKDMADLAA